ncbi:DUF4168 domain-containing protein [Acidithiobacillus thiooxidans]|uniref:DUF4168 domain-containing protein n=1 Tax=Acidithiobacillus thiooxidans TaxID=930 RepID=A0A1C2IZ45_ACITH|nr:DUF4168 domain-containing protein [Acidithiobacillus thiooxidans]OCX69926.1 hypothetical protein A6M23_14510 [Acidithiobacillus thiooxidans]OCX81214.1 hypothetical protein A6P08_14490 [Acidithiobacillus thiooxidans]
MNKGAISVIVLASMMAGSSIAMAASMDSNANQGRPTSVPSSANTHLGHVDHKEFTRFVDSLKTIQPIGMQVKKIEENTKMSKIEKEMYLKSAQSKMIHVLHTNHLQPVVYEQLIHKAETDKSFAKRTEKALHGG